MFTLVKKKNNGRAREQIALLGVRDDIALLPHGNYRSILEVTPLNFELRSEEEQDTIIDMYESFLNSVGVQLQILVRTREIDMDRYLDELGQRLADEPEAIYRNQLGHYDAFIRSLIQSNKILSRHFYIIIPLHSSAKTEFELVREQLQLEVDIVSKGILRLGMHARQLRSLEVLDLFYSFYSPTQAKLQPLTERALQLIHEVCVNGEDR